MSYKEEEFSPGSMVLNQMATRLGTERRILETDYELQSRLIRRMARFENTNGSFYDLVHTAEQAILYETPVAADYVAIRRQVGLGLIAKNKTGNWLVRLKTAFKAFWSCL